MIGAPQQEHIIDHTCPFAMANPLQVGTEETIRLAQHAEGYESAESGAHGNETSLDSADKINSTDANASASQPCTAESRRRIDTCCDNQVTPKQSNKKGSSAYADHRRTQSHDDQRQNGAKPDNSDHHPSADPRYHLRPKNFTFDDLDQEKQSEDTIEPCEALLDETFRDTLELVAQWNDTEHEGGNGVAYATSRREESPSNFSTKSYKLSQYKDGHETPCSRQYYHESPYGSLISPSSVMSAIPYQNPYRHILSLIDAFRDFDFLLPILRTKLVDQRSFLYGPSESDLVVARKRLASVVCFFGGNLQQRLLSGSVDTSATKSSNKRKRPVSLSRSRSKKSNALFQTEQADFVATVKEPNEVDTENDSDETAKSDTEGENRDESMNDEEIRDGTSSVERKKKTTYRCRLCGLPKQKHDCIFRRNLQRTIGTMTYPVVNAFAADEIGFLAPRLADMNNFFTEDEKCSTKVKVAIDGPVATPTGSMTPNSRNAPCPDFPVSSDETSLLPTAQPIAIGSMESVSSQMLSYPHSNLFMKTLTLEPEQLRTITPRRPSVDAYKYAPVSVSLSERARLSNELFKESEKVPYLTDECAMVLQDARELNMWDQAVAELYAQVLTIVFCPFGDDSLLGLSKYLLSHGVAC